MPDPRDDDNPGSQRHSAKGLKNVLSGLLSRIHPDSDDVTEKEILEMVDAGSEAGSIEIAEKEMIENIFEFNNQTAEEVMTHRTKVTFIQVDQTSDEILETIRSSGLSRFPVYDQDIDDIIGTLSARDFLLNLLSKDPRPLRDLIREAYFVPETVPADVLFRDLQKKKIHMAIVVDEYGGMSGIITMEDLLEEIVGNIYDEFDPQAEMGIVHLEDNLWRVPGNTPLDEVADALNVEIGESEEYDTLGGLVFSQLTTIPGDGSRPEVDAEGLHIIVESLKDHRVVSALVSILPDDDGSGYDVNSVSEHS